MALRAYKALLGGYRCASAPPISAHWHKVLLVCVAGTPARITADGCRCIGCDKIARGHINTSNNDSMPLALAYGGDPRGVLGSGVSH